MVYVFYVNTGEMITFDLEAVVQSVAKLQAQIVRRLYIPVDKQILLISGGEILNPNRQVCTYKGSGTDTNPIFLINKSSLEKESAPRLSTSDTERTGFREKVEAARHLKPTYKTLEWRTQLAADLFQSAKEHCDGCELKVHEQHLQHQAYAAAIANLEDTVAGLEKHAGTFRKYCHTYLSRREGYFNTLERVHTSIDLLQRAPLFKCLLTALRADSSIEGQQQASTNVDGSGVIGRTVSDWLDLLGRGISIETVSKQTMEDLQTVNEDVCEAKMSDMQEMIAKAENQKMKVIEGLETRLYHLGTLINNAKEMKKKQGEMLEGFQKNKRSYQISPDASVLPDLCVSHQVQLSQMSANEDELLGWRAKCAKAKGELCDNLHNRFRWVMWIQKIGYEEKRKSLVHLSKLNQLSRTLDLLQQLEQAPGLYAALCTEAYRRKAFTGKYAEWAGNLTVRTKKLRDNEVTRRKAFSKKVGRHFLTHLFPGLMNLPSEFATSPPQIQDEQLPNVSESDIRILRDALPELNEELRVPESTFSCPGHALSPRAGHESGYLKSLTTTVSPVSTDKGDSTLSPTSTEAGETGSDHCSPGGADNEKPSPRSGVRETSLSPRTGVKDGSISPRTDDDTEGKRKRETARAGVPTLGDSEIQVLSHFQASALRSDSSDTLVLDSRTISRLETDTAATSSERKTTLDLSSHTSLGHAESLLRVAGCPVSQSFGEVGSIPSEHSDDAKARTNDQGAHFPSDDDDLRLDLDAYDRSIEVIEASGALSEGRDDDDASFGETDTDAEDSAPGFLSLESFDPADQYQTAYFPTDQYQTANYPPDNVHEQFQTALHDLHSGHSSLQSLTPPHPAYMAAVAAATSAAPRAGSDGTSGPSGPGVTAAISAALKDTVMKLSRMEVAVAETNKVSTYRAKALTDVRQVSSDIILELRNSTQQLKAGTLHAFGECAIDARQKISQVVRASTQLIACSEDKTNTLKRRVEELETTLGEQKAANTKAAGKVASAEVALEVMVKSKEEAVEALKRRLVLEHEVELEDVKGQLQEALASVESRTGNQLREMRLERDEAKESTKALKMNLEETHQKTIDTLRKEFEQRLKVSEDNHLREVERLVSQHTYQFGVAVDNHEITLQEAEEAHRRAMEAAASESQKNEKEKDTLQARLTELEGVFQRETELLTAVHERALREADESHQIELSEAAEAHQKSLQRQEVDHKRAVEEQDKNHAMAIEEQCVSHTVIIKDMEDTNARSMEELVVAHGKAISELKQSHEAVLQEQKAAHQVLLNEIEDQHRVAMDEIIETHQRDESETAEAQQRLMTDMEDRHRRTIDESEQKHQLEQEKGAQKHDDTLHELEVRLKDESQVREKEAVESLKVEHDAEISELKNVHQKEIQELQMANDTCIAEKEASHHTALENLLASSSSVAEEKLKVMGGLREALLKVKEENSLLSEVSQKKTEELIQTMEAEKAKAIEKERVLMQTHHEAELSTLRQQFAKEHKSKMAALKVSFMAESQASFNSAMNKVVQSKDAQITNLMRSQITSPSMVGSLSAGAEPSGGRASVAEGMDSSVNVIGERERESPRSLNPAEQKLTEELKTKEEELARLRKQMFLVSQSMTASAVGAQDKIAITSCSKGDIVLICLNEDREHYVVFTVTKTLYFLHNDCLKDLGLDGSVSEQKTWVLATVVDKEFCEAKRSPNRFRVPRGTRFYRVRARLWTPSESLVSRRERRESEGSSTEPRASGETRRERKESTSTGSSEVEYRGRRERQMSTGSDESRQET